MKRVTLDVLESVRYVQSFEVPDDFDETDMGLVHELWTEKGNFNDVSEVDDRDIEVLDAYVVAREPEVAS